MAIRLKALQLPKLLTWCTQRLPATFKLQAELRSHPRASFPDVDFFVDRWPHPAAVAAIVDPKGRLPDCRAYFRNKMLGLYGEDSEALRSLLAHCPHVDWTQPVEIEAVADHVIPVLQPLIADDDNTRVWPCVLLKATPRDVEPIPLPEGMKVSPVTDATADIVNLTWKFSDAHSGSYIRHLARNFPSVVMTTARGDYVGHILSYSYWAVGFLHVAPQFRKGGYAKAIVSQLTQTYFNVGKDAFGFVDEDNLPSFNLLRSLGWKPAPDLFSWFSAKLSVCAK